MDKYLYLLKGDKTLWVWYLIMIMLSVLMVYTSQQSLTLDDGDTLTPILQHMTHHMLGFVVCWSVSVIPSRWLRLASLALPISWILLICIQMVSGLVNGAIRWMPATELCKISTIISIAMVLSRTQGTHGARPVAFSLCMKVLAPSLLLIIPDNLSTGMILLTSSFLLMFVGRVPARQLISFVALLFAVAVFFIAFANYVPDDILQWSKDIPGLHRLSTWCHRVQDFGTYHEIDWDLAGKDAQRAAGYMAIVNGKWFGLGIGNTFMCEYLPLAFSDMISCVIIEELGIEGCAFVLYMYIILIVRVYRIARVSPNTFRALMIIGLILMLFIQTLINFFVGVGIMPVTGQPLPFLSRGGWSIISCAAILGIVLNVSRSQNHTK